MKLYMKLKLLRADQDLTQEQLAEKSGLDRNTIARIESKNLANCPRPASLVKIAKALNVDVKELLECEM